MLIRLICYAAVAFIGGAAISSGYFAFISLIGVFPKLAEKVKGDRHYMLIECLLAYGAVVGNVIYLFNIRIPLLSLCSAVYLPAVWLELWQRC